MPLASRILPIACLVALAGCGENIAPTTAGDATPTRGGAVYPLSENRGFVEIVSQGGTSAKKKQPGQVLVYFLKPDKSAPLQPTPAGVTFTPLGGQPVELTVNEDHFESPGGSIPMGKFAEGELTGTIGGGTFTIDVR